MYQRLKELSRDQFLTPHECAKLCSAPKRNSLIGLRDYAVLKTFLNLGLRKQELCNVKVGDLFQDGKDWILKVHGKGGTLDEIDVTNYDLIDAIRKYLAKSGHADNVENWLFQSTEPKPNNSSKKLNRLSVDFMIKKYTKISGITKSVHAHTLRHTFGTQLFSLVKDIRIVQRAMRHRDMNSTMLYMHTNRDELKNGLAQLAL